jgi:hypothetical protein
MENCPYCNAEIESNSRSCPSCGRYLAVEVSPVDELGPEGEDFRERWSSGRMVFHRIGCDGCIVRFLLILFLVLGFWSKPFWYMALFVLLIELSMRFNRK